MSSMQTSNPEPTQQITDYQLLIPESDPAYPWTHSANWTSDAGHKYFNQPGAPGSFGLAWTNFFYIQNLEFTLSVIVDEITCDLTPTNGMFFSFGSFISDEIYSPGEYLFHNIQTSFASQAVLFSPQNSMNNAYAKISMFSLVLEDYANFAIRDLGLGLARFTKYASSLQPPGSYMLQIGTHKTPSNLQIKITP